MEPLVSHNGEIIDSSQATLAINSPGFQSSQAIYTSVRTYNGKPFQLEQHLERLRSSAAEVGFALSQSLETIRGWVLQIIEESSFSPHFLRITATPDDIFIESRPLEIDSIVYEGVSVISVPMTRELVKAKVVGSPGTNRAYQKARSQDSYEALLRNPSTNKLTEGSRSNLLWIKEGVLNWCDEALSGITQAAVLELAAQLKIPTHQSELDYDELGKIEELFLTQTSRGIVPILQVDDVKVSNGKVGETTKQLMQAFEELTQSL